MAKYATHITILLCFIVAGISAPLTVRELRRPVGPVDVQPVPVVEVSYRDAVRAAVADIPTDTRSYAATQYEAMAGLCKLPFQPKDDGAYQNLIETIRTSRYGDPYPFKDQLAKLTDVTDAEARKRGLLEDGKAVDWDKDKWQQFAIDTLGGLLP